MRKLSLRGESIVGVLVGIVIAVSSILYFARLQKSATHTWKGVGDQIAASLYVTELAEVFRAHGSRQFVGYLRNNPVCPGCNPYNLCSHINILDRATKTIANEDPLASLDTRSQVLLEGNRFYMVQVMDLRDQTINSAYCTLNPRQVCIEGDVCASGLPDRCSAGTTCPSGELGLSSHERFLVTVGVSWKNPDGGGQQPRFAQTVIIPDLF